MSDRCPTIDLKKILAVGIQIGKALYALVKKDKAMAQTREFDMEQWYLYLIAGLVAGIISALFGVGAGIVTIPILVLGFGMAQKSAQGTALMVMIPMALVGALRYKLNPDVEVSLVVVGLMAAGGVVGALIGSQWAFKLHPVVLKRMFGVFVIIAGFNILYKTRKQSAVPPAEPGQVQETDSKV
jgi:uncharacterized membrane protein YfcA